MSNRVSASIDKITYEKVPGTVFDSKKFRINSIKSTDNMEKTRGLFLVLPWGLSRTRTRTCVFWYPNLTSPHILEAKSRSSPLRISSESYHRTVATCPLSDTKINQGQCSQRQLWSLGQPFSLCLLSSSPSLSLWWFHIIQKPSTFAESS